MPLPRPHSAKQISATLFFAAALACGGARAGSDTAAGATTPVEAGEPGLHITMAMRSPEQGARLDIEYRISAGEFPLPSRLRVAFPANWAGRDGFLDDFVAITAEDGAGTPLPSGFSDGGILVIETGRARVATLRYRVRPMRSLLSHGSRFRALLSADRFFAPGHAILAQPLDLGATVTSNVELVTVVDDPRWALRASIPLDDAPSLQRLVDAAFFAGPFRHGTRRDGPRVVDVWIERTLDVRPEAVAELAARVVEEQTPVLGPVIAAQTTVIVLRRDDDPLVLDGSGRAGGFVLELGTGAVELDESVVQLVAHENLHRLNGHTLRFARSEEFETLWFSEGVTDYVATRRAAESGLTAERAFFATIGRALSLYRGNPASAVPAGANRGNAYWADRDIRRLPYDKGALLGLLIDLQLRRQERGNIDGFLAFLRDDASTRLLPLTNGALRDGLERYSGSSWAEFWAAYVVGNEPLPVFERLNEVGIEVVERIEPAPYYGFRSSVSVEGQWYVSFVEPGSPAERAGLYEGLELVAEPYQPDRTIGVTALVEGRTDRGRRTFAVEATMGQRRAYALTERIEGADEYRRLFGFSDR